MITLPFVSQTDIDAALRVLERRCATVSPDDIRVSVNGMPVHFSARVYYATEDVQAACRAAGIASQIALCLGSRHNDGYVREQCLQRLLLAEAPWMVPFVLQLLGEYVVEISTVIDGFLADCIPARYMEFANENPGHMHRLHQQATSYWNEYYRRAYPNRHEYPALRALQRLADGAATLGVAIPRR